jgi:hypothetical protein
MSARGEDWRDILKEVFDLDYDTADPKKINAAKQTAHRWRKRPDFDEIWKDEIKKIMYKTTGKALKVINRQLDNEDVPWLQNKAANDLLAFGKLQLFADEDKTVTVKIEGAPEIGSPDGEE